MTRPRILATRRNVRLFGTSIAPGVAMGKAFVYRHPLEDGCSRVRIRREQIPNECDRIDRAGKDVLRELEGSARRVTEQIGAYQAEIFKAHHMMLQQLLETHEIWREIEREHVRADTAACYVFERRARKMRMAESTQFSQRADDVADLGCRFLRALKGISVHSLEAMPEGRVVVASRLLPSDAVFLASRHAGGIVVEFGAAGSHCALLARQIRIPGVANVTNAADRIHTGDLVLVDAFREAVVVAPDEYTLDAFATRIRECETGGARAKARCAEPALTRDGVHVPVMANIANEAEAEMAADNGADGVGLYRLEGLFMLRKSLPSETELLAQISETLAPLRGKPATIRLLDLGSDKGLPWLAFEEEPAPCLGRRGVRLLIAHPELLRVQVRALLRLSQAQRLQIMVPFVTTAKDMEVVRNVVQFEASELGIGDLPPLVAMIETPAAALSVPEILKFSDGLSLGTNDLAQYTMAAGRQNPDVQRYFQDDHPAVLRLIRLAVREADGTPVAICGELPAQPEAVPILLDAGVRLLSVAPPFVPAVKEAVRGYSRTDDARDASTP